MSRAVSAIAHDLRNQIGVWLGWLDVAIDHGRCPACAKELEEVRAAGRRMLKLVHELETGEQEPEAAGVRAALRRLWEAIADGFREWMAR